MEGYLLKYKAIDSYKRVLFNHTLCGRIVYQKYRGKTYAYYIPGMLHDKLFIRPANGMVFVENIDNIDFEQLSMYATVEVEESYLNRELEDMKTGLEYWRDISNKKGLDFHVKNRRQSRANIEGREC